MNPEYYHLTTGKEPSFFQRLRGAPHAPSVPVSLDSDPFSRRERGELPYITHEEVLELEKRWAHLRHSPSSPSHVLAPNHTVPTPPSANAHPTNQPEIRGNPIKRGIRGVNMYVHKWTRSTWDSVKNYRKIPDWTITMSAGVLSRWAFVDTGLIDRDSYRAIGLSALALATAASNMPDLLDYPPVARRIPEKLHRPLRSVGTWAKKGILMAPAFFTGDRIMSAIEPMLPDQQADVHPQVPSAQYRGYGHYGTLTPESPMQNIHPTETVPQTQHHRLSFLPFVSSGSPSHADVIQPPSPLPSPAPLTETTPQQPPVQTVQMKIDLSNSVANAIDRLADAANNVATALQHPVPEQPAPVVVVPVEQPIVSKIEVNIDIDLEPMGDSVANAINNLAHSVDHFSEAQNPSADELRAHGVGDLPHHPHTSVQETPPVVTKPAATVTCPADCSQDLGKPIEELVETGHAKVLVVPQGVSDASHVTPESLTIDHKVAPTGALVDGNMITGDLHYDEKMGDLHYDEKIVRHVENLQLHLPGWEGTQGYEFNDALFRWYDQQAWQLWTDMDLRRDNPLYYVFHAANGTISKADIPTAIKYLKELGILCLVH